MRRILIDNARRKNRVKRGGNYQRIDLEKMRLSYKSAEDQILAINDAVEQFATEDSLAAQLVKLRYSVACRSKRRPKSAASHVQRLTNIGLTPEPVCVLISRTTGRRVAIEKLRPRSGRNTRRWRTAR